MREMQISDMKKLNKDESKIRAFFSVDFGDFLVRDFKLIQGDRGIFAAAPSTSYIDKKTNEKKWYGIFSPNTPEVMEKITALAQKAYSGQSTPPALDTDIPF